MFGLATKTKDPKATKSIFSMKCALSKRFALFLCTAFPIFLEATKPTFP